MEEIKITRLEFQEATLKLLLSFESDGAGMTAIARAGVVLELMNRRLFGTREFDDAGEAWGRAWVE